ncbi:hypothetical protein [Sphingomonas arenae]|uniref:hypothetical protein n=1 Tax=Sphingomonas arenae TaxID=2812555 RepID=UPI0019679250|nr:hypothetical protein [Sphingomonas arenae]
MFGRAPGSIGAGAVYFALIFGLGFVLGTVRVLLLEPALGLGRATLVELPVMLLASWAACGWVLRRSAVETRGQRVVMGTVAFVLLMVAELGVSTLLMRRSVAEHLATYGDTPRQWGLAAQIAFAAFPLLRRQARPSASRA